MRSIEEITCQIEALKKENQQLKKEVDAFMKFVGYEGKPYKSSKAMDEIPKNSKLTSLSN